MFKGAGIQLALYLCCSLVLLRVQPCEINCLSCDETTCLECQVGYYAKGRDCHGKKNPVIFLILFKSV